VKPGWSVLHLPCRSSGSCRANGTPQVENRHFGAQEPQARPVVLGRAGPDAPSVRLPTTRTISGQVFDPFQLRDRPVLSGIKELGFRLRQLRFRLTKCGQVSRAYLHLVPGDANHFRGRLAGSASMGRLRVRNQTSMESGKAPFRLRLKTPDGFSGGVESGLSTPCRDHGTCPIGGNQWPSARLWRCAQSSFPSMESV